MVREAAPTHSTGSGPGCTAPKRLPGTYTIGTLRVFGAERLPGTYTIGTPRVNGAERLPGTYTIGTPRVYGAERLPGTYTIGTGSSPNTLDRERPGVYGS